MLFKLSKADIDRRDALVSQLEELRSKLEDAVSHFNAEVEKLREPVEQALEAYNEAVGEARSFAEDNASEGEAAYDERSERWQEGERGQAAQQWVQQWQQVQLDDYEISFPDELAFDAPSHSEDLNDLPVELEV